MQTFSSGSFCVHITSPLDYSHILLTSTPPAFSTPRHSRLDLRAAPGRLAKYVEDLISQLSDLLQVPLHPLHAEQHRRLPGGLFQALCHVLHHISGILIEYGIVLHDQEAVVILLQDVNELEEGEGAAHFQLREVAIQPTKDAGVVNAVEEDLVALHFQVAALGSGRHLHRGD